VKESDSASDTRGTIKKGCDPNCGDRHSKKRPETGKKGEEKPRKPGDRRRSTDSDLGKDQAFHPLGGKGGEQP